MTDSRLYAASTGLCHSEPAYLDGHFSAAQPEYESMLRAVGIGAGVHVLDGGCGSGSYLPLLAELVGPKGRVSALDLAPESVAGINARFAASPLPCPMEARVGTVLALPYADHTFDAVWISAVLQYLTDEEVSTALTECRRVVRPGGLVAIKDADLTCWYFSPIEPVVLWRSLAAIRPHFAQVNGALGMLKLYQKLERAGLSGVRQTTTLVERRAPLRPVEEAFIGTMITTMVKTVEVANLPDPDRAAWRALEDLSRSDHPIRQSDFYYREAHVLAVGRVP